MQSPESPARKSDVASFVVRLRPRRVLVALGAIIAVLALASTAAGATAWVFDWQEGSRGYALVSLVWLGSENNVPTTYQIVALAGAGMLSFVLAGESPPVMPQDRWRWRLLGSTFMFLALSEGARIHETVGEATGFDFGGSDGLEQFVYGPAMFYLPAAVVLATCLIPLLRRLDSRTRGLLVGSGMLYVGAAAGLDNVALMYADAVAGKRTVLYAALALLEEVIEKVAIALYIYALLDYLGRRQIRPDRGYDH